MFRVYIDGALTPLGFDLSIYDPVLVKNPNNVMSGLEHNAVINTNGIDIPKDGNAVINTNGIGIPKDGNAVINTNGIGIPKDGNAVINTKGVGVPKDEERTKNNRVISSGIPRAGADLLGHLESIPLAIGPHRVELRATNETGTGVDDVLPKIMETPDRWPRPVVFGVDVDTVFRPFLKPHEPARFFIPHSENSDHDTACDGCIVSTSYNGRFYRLQGLRSADNPELLEKLYKERYGIEVTIDSPLLWATDGAAIRNLKIDAKSHPEWRDGWFHHRLVEKKLSHASPSPFSSPSEENKEEDATMRTNHALKKCQKKSTKKKSPILLVPQLCTLIDAPPELLHALCFVQGIQDHLKWYSRVGYLEPFIALPLPQSPCWASNRHFHAGPERAFFLLLSALSWPGEFRGPNLELLEWFGDACVDVLASMEAHDRCLPIEEAEALRSKLISNKHLASTFSPLRFEWPYDKMKNADNQKACADVLEALVGALTLAYGLERAKEFLEALNWAHEPLPLNKRPSTLPSTLVLVGKAVSRFLVLRECVLDVSMPVKAFHSARLFVGRMRKVWHQVGDAWLNHMPMEYISKLLAESRGKEEDLLEVKG